MFCNWWHTCSLYYANSCVGREDFMKVWILYLSSIVSSFSPKKNMQLRIMTNRGRGEGFDLKCLVPLLWFENSLVFCQAFSVFDCAELPHVFKCHLLWLSLKSKKKKKTWYCPGYCLLPRHAVTMGIYILKIIEWIYIYSGYRMKCTFRKIIACHVVDFHLKY